ncbi:MAG: hypothetical protein JST59_29275 [Actinobacteria bacterium]|nr:hypothetical protein [Actinomycetota bacterium]
MGAMPWLIAAVALLIGGQLISDGRRAFLLVGLLVAAVGVLLVLATVFR